MTKIYLVRHGEAEGNLYRRCHGWYDSLLTKNAVDKQIPALEKRFSDIRLDAVYSSDRYRACMTVLPIAESHHLSLISEPGLREMNLGSWEDRTWGELPRIYPEEMDAWDHRPWEVRVEGGEAYQEVEKRLRRTLLSIAEKHEGGTVLAGTHGVAARSVLCRSLFGSLTSMKKVGWCDNTAVSLLMVENGKISIDFYNDNSHLDQSSSTLETQRWWRSIDDPEDFHLWFRPVDLKTDVKKLLSYGEEFYKSAYGESTEFHAEEFLEESRRMQKAYPRALLFAMLKEEEYGLLRVDTEAFKDSECGLIKTIVVNREARGKGFAPQVLGETVSIYRHMGKKFIAAGVAGGNERATRFYEKNGFFRAGEIPGHVVMKKDIEVRNPFRI